MAVSEYEQPFRAEDFGPGERLATSQHQAGIQGLGKDITAMRLVGGKEWSSTYPNTSADSNDSRVIYDKPFYAMAPGVVVAGWRNAPENPGPGQTHPERESGRIGGGGNCLWILQDDGIMALYAHARPGTIPHRLVPQDAELLSGPNTDPGRFHPESIIPPEQRVRVKAGQELGKVGNSGKSSTPHLHVHMEAGKSADGSGASSPHPMRFRRGLATPRTGHTADNDAWTSFAGNTIPNGPVLIWPPRTVRAEYARHGFEPDAFGRLFAHLNDSGYQPEWFDGYRVGGDVFYNFVWRPASGGWKFWRGLASEDYNTKVNAAFSDGFSPSHVESYLDGDGAPRYAAIVVRDQEKEVIARHGLSLQEHRDWMDRAKRRKLSPVCVSVVSVSGERRYTVLYRPVDIGRWAIHSQIPVRDFQSKFDEMRDDGLSPQYVAAYVHGGQVYYSVVFASRGSADRKTRHGLDPDEYQEVWAAHTGDNRLTRVVTGYDGATDQHRYVGVWS